MSGSPVRFRGNAETLLIPLCAKARESNSSRRIIHDPKAAEIVQNIDRDLTELKIPAKTQTMMSLRAVAFDDIARDFLEHHPGSLVLHPGCGLDSRVLRVNAKAAGADWYDLDYPDVIDVRRRFFEEDEHYHMIPSSLTRLSWIDELPVKPGKQLVLAEGLLMYLRRSNIRAVLGKLRRHLGEFTLVFDTFSTFTAKHVARHPSLRKTGASVRWGIDDPQEMEELVHGLSFRKEIYFMSGKYIEKLHPATRLVYRFANCFRSARKAHRIMIYDMHAVKRAK